MNGNREVKLALSAYQFHDLVVLDRNIIHNTNDSDYEHVTLLVDRTALEELNNKWKSAIGVDANPKEYRGE